MLLHPTLIYQKQSDCMVRYYANHVLITILFLGMHCVFFVVGFFTITISIVCVIEWLNSYVDSSYLKDYATLPTQVTNIPAL